MELAGGGRQSNWRGYSAVVLAVLLLPIGAIVASLVFRSGLATSRQYASIRVYGATLVLLPIVIRRWPKLTRREYTMVAALGVLGIALPQWIYFEAIALIPVPIALVIIYTAPFVVNGIERVFLHRRLPGITYLAMVVALAAVAVTLLAGDGGLGGLSTVGILLSVLCVFAYAVQLFVWSKQPLHVSPLVTTGIGLLFASAFSLVISPIWQLPFGDATGAVDAGPRLAGSFPLWAAALLSIVIGTAIPYVLFGYGTPRIGPGATSVTAMLEPATSAVLAAVVLADVLTPIQIVGVAVTLAAVTTAELARTRQRHSP